MRIEQIEQVIEIAKTGSINKAAHNLFISQPSLSSSIKSLETELNVSLFTRSQRGIVLTPEGQRFLHFAAPVHQQYSLLTALFDDFKSRDKKVFRVACSYLKMGSKAFARTVSHFADCQYNCQYKELATQNIIEDISQQIVDIGLIYFTDIQKKKMLHQFKLYDLKYTHLKSYNFVLVCGPNNGLYNSELDSVSIDILQKYPLLIYQTSTFDSELVEQNMLNATHAPRTITVNSRATMHELLHKTDAVKIGFELDIAGELAADGLRRIPMQSPMFSVELGMLQRLNHFETDIELYYIEQIKQLINL